MTTQPQLPSSSPDDPITPTHALTNTFALDISLPAQPLAPAQRAFNNNICPHLFNELVPETKKWYRRDTKVKMEKIISHQLHKVYMSVRVTSASAPVIW